MRILIVDDNYLVAFGLETVLRGGGHTVTGTAQSHGDAVEALQLHAPELALLDIDLDYHGAGLDLAQLCAEQHIAVIFLTGRPDAARSITTGAVGLISKPYTATTILDAISFVRRRQLGEAPGIPSGLEVFARVSQ